jgi:hypothetical protein
VIRTAALALAAALAVSAIAAAGPTPAPWRNSDGSPRALPPGPPDDPGRTLVLAYDDFGGDALARGLLGPGYWSWTECACYEPDDVFDVRVVVYRGVSRSHVAERYPTRKDVADYRYVERDAALTYLGEQLRETAGDPDLVEVQLLLIDTRARIVAALGAPRRRP